MLIDQEAKAKKASKTKFSCPECGQNAWAKPDASLICGNCYDDGEGDICLMAAEPSSSQAFRPRPASPSANPT
jgi:ribosomal protein S27AE